MELTRRPEWNEEAHMKQFEGLQLFDVYQHDNLASTCNLSICDICDVGANTLFAKIYDIYLYYCTL